MEPRVIQIGNYRESEDRKFDNPQCGRVYSVEGLSPTINTCQGGDREPKILLKMEEKEIIPYNTPEDGVAPTITTMYARLGTNNLTPGEYGGAMGIMEISKDKMEERNIKGVNVHPLSHKLEFDGNVNEEVSPCLRATDYKAPHCVWEEEPKSCASRKRGDEHKIETRNDEIANCVTSIDTDSMVQEPLKIPQATKQGYIECPVGGVFDASYPNSELRRGRVQENGEISPALTTNSEGAILRYEGVDPQIIQKVGDRGTDNYSVKDISNTIPANPMSDRGQLLIEPQILTPLRTEEGRQLRKQGIEKFSNRALYSREDGVSNTITSVQKDNLLQEPNGTEYKGKLLKEGDAVDTSRSKTFGTHVMDGVSPTLRSERPDANAVCVEDGGDPLVVTREYTDYGGMSRPFSKINISRVCTIGEFFNKFLDTFSYDLSDYKGKIYFRYDFDETQNEVVFENLEEALKSEILIIRLNGNFYDAWYDDKPWQFCGFKLQYPGYVKNVPKTHYRIRKLTEREVFRLMGLKDEDIDKIQAAGISKTSQYRLAGNSIVVDVLYYIFKSLFIDTEDRSIQPSLF